MLARRGILGLALIGSAGLAGKASAQARVQPVPGSLPAQPTPAAPPAQPKPLPVSAFGLDASHFGLRPGATEDQSKRLQEALIEAVRRNAPLALPPGRYRVANVVLPEGARLVGVGDATVLAVAEGAPALSARRIRRASVASLAIDGLGLRGKERTGLISVEDVPELTIDACDLRHGGTSGIVLQRSGGRITDCRLTLMRDAGLFSLDGRGLVIERNVIEDIGNNAIQLWRSTAGDEQAQVRANRIVRVRNDAGGDGPNGNGIQLFRAGGVIVEGNTLRDCALTFVRNNGGSGVQIIGNNGRRCGEAAYYAEFAFEGAVIANNIAEDVAQGVNITNLDHGGRLAICSGNLIRRVRKGLAPKGKEIIGGLGIHVEAEAAVTGNVIEDVSDIGLSLGWSWGMRNLVATGNMVRDCPIGVGISLVPRERNVVVANNVIAGARLGAVVGTEYGRAVTGDLTRAPSARAQGVRVEGNAVA
jgi:uncharacterized secreted repeat protein (TIGR03808 family)